MSTSDRIGTVLSKVKVGREDMLSLVNTLVKKVLKISTLRASPCTTLPSV